MAEWTAYTGASIHNVVVKGDSAYIAYYTEGLQVVDIGNPRSPQLAGYYDTYPGGRGLFDGNWGVYPFARNGNIYWRHLGGLIVGEDDRAGERCRIYVDAADTADRATGSEPDLVLLGSTIRHESKTFDLNGRTRRAEHDRAIGDHHSEPEPSGVRHRRRSSRVTMPTRVDVDLCVRSARAGRSSAVRRASPAGDAAGIHGSGGSRGVDLRWRRSATPGTARAVVSRAEREARRNTGRALRNARPLELSE